jgi:hypothetical protein
MISIINPGHNCVMLGMLIHGFDPRVIVLTDEVKKEDYLKDLPVLVFTREDSHESQKNFERSFPKNPSFGRPPRELGRKDLLQGAQNRVKRRK